MIPVDYHPHSTFSKDREATVAEVCDAALARPYGDRVLRYNESWQVLEERMDTFELLSGESVSPEIVWRPWRGASWRQSTWEGQE